LKSNGDVSYEPQRILLTPLVTKVGLNSLGGQYKGRFDNCVSSNNLIITIDYLGWEVNKWSGWRDSRPDLTPRPPTCWYHYVCTILLLSLFRSRLWPFLVNYCDYSKLIPKLKKWN